MIGREENLIDLLVLDHHRLGRLATEVRNAAGRQRWRELATGLVIHEIVEEELVYPAVQRIGGMDETVDSALSEQIALEAVLFRMEHLEPASVEFSGLATILSEAMADHAHREEVGVFRRLRAGTEEEELIVLGQAVARIEESIEPSTELLTLIDHVRGAARSVFAGAY